MPALAETQLPFLQRDVENGHLPQRLRNECDGAYYRRLGLLYGLPTRVVQEALQP